MRITAPVTDYIRRSILTTQGDLAVRGAVVPVRLPAGANNTYLQGKGAGVIPAYAQTMPPLLVKGDLIIQGAVNPQRYPTAVVGRVLTDTGSGNLPSYWSLFELLTTKGDVWVRGDTHPQRLAAGALDTYFKARGAENLPIYEKLALRDTGVKMEASGRNSAGVQVITGVGFRPSVVIFLAVDATSDNINWSIGFDDGVLGRGVYVSDGGTRVYLLSPNTMHIHRGVGNTLGGYITSLGADGFTITWTLAGVVSLDFIYLCLP